MTQTEDPVKRPRVLKPLVGAAALVIVISGLKAGGSFLVPFFFAAFISTLASSFVAWLQRYRVPQYVAICVVVIISIALLAVVVVLVGNSVSVFTESIPSYREEFRSLADPIKNWFHRHQLDIVYTTFLSSLEPSALMDMLTTGLRKLMTALSGTLLMLIIMIFIMSETASFKKKLHIAFGNSASISRLEEIAGDVQRYLAIKTFTSSVTGLAVGMLVLLVGVDFAVLWGFSAFMLNFIPVIGSIIASIPAILLAVVQLGFGHALALAAGYFIVNNVISNLLEPVLMGRRLGLSPLVIFLSLVFWGYVWGIAGMLLAVPLTMVIRIFLEHSDDLSWLAILMSGRDSTDTSTTHPGQPMQSRT